MLATRFTSLFLFGCLLSLITPSFGAYLIANIYDDDYCTQDATTISVIPCNTCIFSAGNYSLASCSGQSATVYSCSDSSCSRCEKQLSAPLGTCSEGTIVSVSNTFPPVPAMGLVISAYSDAFCTNPTMWVIQYLSADMQENYQDLCRYAYTGACITGDQIDSAFVGAKAQCSNAFIPPYGSTGAPTTVAPTQPPPNCTVGQCSFYQNCVQRSVQCDASDYAMGYGYKYCNAYMDRLSEFSTSGRQWVQNVLSCLQVALVPVVQTTPRPTCPAIRNSAFESHSSCYLSNSNANSICFLPSDWPLVMSIVWKGLLSADGVSQVFSTASGCFTQYKLSTVYKISGIISSATETLASLISKISNLIGIPSQSISILDSSSATFNWYSSTQKRQITATGNFTADITFVFYASTEDAVKEYEVQATSALQNQTVWPTASVQTCQANNASYCKSSNEVIGPSTQPPPTSSSPYNSAASSLFSFSAIVITLFAGFAISM